MCKFGLMYLIKRFIFISLIFSFYNQSILYAGFEDIGVGARSIAMGNSLNALSDDVYSVYYNPAGLNELKNKEITLDYNKLYSGLDDNSNLGTGFIGYAQPLGIFGKIGIGLLNFTLSGYYIENTLIIAYAKNFPVSFLDSPVSVGFKIKMLSKEYKKTEYTENAVNLDTGQKRGGLDPVFIDGYSRTGVSCGFGVIYKIRSEHIIGLNIEDITEPNLGLITEDKIPLKMKIGYGCKIDKLNINSELKFIRNDYIVSAGAEYLFEKNFYIRSGLSLGSREFVNLSLGIGLEYNKMFQFDYCFSYPIRGISDITGTHQISIIIRK